MSSYFLLIFMWLCYGLTHSLLASKHTKLYLQKRIPGLKQYYRLSYNLLALLLLIPPLAVGYYTDSPTLWQWQGILGGISIILSSLALLGFLYSLRYYDMREFLGIRSASTLPAFTLSPLHRIVRHPWYSFALIIIWTRDMSGTTLISAICITLYFFIGAYFEEKKLIDDYGATYRRYCRSVGGIIPRPWKILSAAQANELLKNTN
jgi:protein-S-isoprenylcysteine O-methyltransferase Ste14